MGYLRASSPGRRPKLFDSSVNEGNAKISFRSENGVVHAGQIYEIWKIPIELQSVKTLIVEQYLALKAIGSSKDPFVTRPLLFGKTYYDRSELVAVEPPDILCHAIVRNRSGGTFSRWPNCYCSEHRSQTKNFTAELLKCNATANTISLYAFGRKLPLMETSSQLRLIFSDEETTDN